MSARLTLFCAIALLTAKVATADIIHVPGDRPTIQSALDIAGPGDIVQVAPGTYYENIIWPPVDGIHLVGADPSSTVIDGSRVASVIRIEAPDVITGATLIEGFTITNGFAQPPWPDSQGGGIYLFRADPILRNLWILENEADDFGGGVYSWWADPTLIRVLIARNTAVSRGGVDCFHGAPHFDHVTVANNTPGGIRFDTRSLPLLENSIVAFNYGYGIQLYGTYIEPTQIDLAYTDIHGGILLVGVVEVNDLGGNITADPRFVDHGAGDYTLLEDSPCIDAADPSYPLDPDGTRSDMGVFPYDQSTTAVDPVAVGFESGLKLAIGPNPFVSSTSLSYSLPVAAPVTMTVFDPAGRTIRVLVDRAFQGPGRGTMSWDGTDAFGRRVASGIYLLRLEAGGLAETRAVAVIH